MRIGASSVEQRVAWGQERRVLGLQAVWQQADAAGITHPVEQADFLLRRLYPEMPESWFRDVVTKLRALHERGEWHGFERPPVSVPRTAPWTLERLLDEDT